MYNKGDGPRTQTTNTGSSDNTINAVAEFTARALIAKVEKKLKDEINRYDVYCEWYQDSDVEIWLRDRSDDSRIGPLDPHLLGIKD